MDIFIYDRNGATSHKPTKKTKVLCIFDSFGERREMYPEWAASECYAAVEYYVFDDLNPRGAESSVQQWRKEGLQIFDEELADRILQNFENSDGAESLLVCCRAGISKSSAVAIALNEIYGLGNNTELLKERYPFFNRHVYETLIETVHKRRKGVRKVKITVLHKELAAKYVPKAAARMIRIIDTSPELQAEYPAIEDESLYTSIFEYFFDDINMDRLPVAHSLRERELKRIIDSQERVFDEDLAARILSDFSQHSSRFDELVVHCNAGQSRSPAVAIALNEIFGLGNCSWELKARYPNYNTFVYSLLLNAAKQQ